MKQQQNPLKVLFFLSIYCFGIFVSAQTLPSFSTQNNKQKEYNTNTASILHAHTQASENLLSGFSDISISNLKLSYTDFSLFEFSNELFFKTKFKQYQNYYDSLLLKNKKINLIFPFHSFW